MKEKKKWKHIIICVALLFIGYIMFASTNAWAVPNLGVATDGIYYVAPGDTFQPYQNYYASGSAPDSMNGGNHGFALGSSGSDLHIFTNILDADIYLLTDTDAWDDANPITFDGMDFVIIENTNQADGYKPTPYYGVNLGPVCSQFDGNNNCIAVSSGWNLLPSDPFEPEPFYEYTAAIEYNNIFPAGSYFFAAADEADNGTGSPVFQKGSGDPFSPKTTSAAGVHVPEASSILLLGTCLGGLLGVRKKFRI